MSPLIFFLLIGLVLEHVPLFPCTHLTGKYEVLNCTCYANQNPGAYRIIGGTSITHTGAFPWQVSIQKKPYFWPLWYTDKDKIARHGPHSQRLLCDDSRSLVIIGNLQLSFANGPLTRTIPLLPSFDGKKIDNFRVGYGTPDLLEMYNKGNYLTIATVTPHPNYTKTKETNDIALVLVNGRFKWSESVKPACLATSKYVTEHKGQLMVTGWGVASYPILNETTRYVLNKPRRPRYLKVAYGRDQSNTSKCLAFGRPVDKSQEKYGRHYNRSSTTRCTSGSPYAGCLGDSGGPLHELNEKGQAVVIGLVMSGEHEYEFKALKILRTCVLMDFYTRLSAQMDWVKSVIGDRPGQHYCAIHYCTDKFCV